MKISANEFNVLYEEGTLVKYYPISGEDNFEETKTRSIAWELGHGEVVVMVEGRTGGVAVSNIEIVPAILSPALLNSPIL
jgi:hypothetical protein